MNTVVMLLLLLIALLLLFWQISNLASIIFGSPYVSVKKKIIPVALKLTNPKENEILFDLGCGNGQVLIEGQKLGLVPTGFEIAPAYFLLAKLRTFRYSKIKIVMQNIENVDLKNADIIYCYLLPKFLAKLTPKFKKELKLGARIVSVGFEIKELNYTKKIMVDNNSIYLYDFSS